MTAGFLNGFKQPSFQEGRVLVGYILVTDLSHQHSHLTYEFAKLPTQQQVVKDDDNSSYSTSVTATATTTVTTPAPSATAA